MSIPFTQIVSKTYHLSTRRGILQQIDKLKSDLKKVVDEQTRKGSWNRLFRFCSEIEMVKWYIMYWI